MGKLTSSYVKSQKGRKPIVVTNPNDPKLKSYNDSLKIYNAFHDAHIKQFKDTYEQNKKDYAKDPVEYRRLQGYGSLPEDIVKATTPAQDFMTRFKRLSEQEARTKPKLNSDGTIKNPFKNPFWMGSLYKPKEVEKIAERIAPVGVIGEYPDVYRKPEQPVILASQQPIIKKSVVKKAPVAVTPAVSTPVSTTPVVANTPVLPVSAPVTRFKRVGERIVPDNKMGNGYPNIDNVYINGSLDSIQNQAGDRLKYGSKFTKEWQYKGVTPTTKLDNGGSLSKSLVLSRSLTDNTKTPLVAGNQTVSGGGHYNPEDTSVMLGIAKAIDPTGITNWPDVYRAAKGKPGTNIGVELLASLPLVGKAGKVVSLLDKTLVGTRTSLPLFKMGRGFSSFISSASDLTGKSVIDEPNKKEFGGATNTTDMRLSTKYKKKMENGGIPLNPEEQAAKFAKKDRLNGQLGAGLAIASEVAPMFVNTSANEYGVDKGAGVKGALSSGLKMAATGAAFGPWGAAAGLVVGATLGSFQANKEQKAAKQLEADTKLSNNRMERTRSSNQYKSFVAGNPNFEKGSLTASYYKYGGSAIKTSGGAVKFEGPSHADGGINIGNGIEVEGKETMQDGFVFSDKLGFSSIHKKFLNTLDILDKKPASKAVANSINATHKKIEDLKVAQEAYKSSLDIPNDFDGTSGNLLSKKEFGVGGKTSHSLNIPTTNAVDPEEEAARARLQYMKETNPGGMIPGQEDVPNIPATFPIIPQAKLAAKFLLDMNQPGAVKAFVEPAGTNDLSKKSNNNKISKNLTDTFMNAAPYISNLVNAQNIKRIPMPNSPVLQNVIQAPQVNYDNQIEEAKRNELLGTKLAEKYISSGSGIAAIAAAGASSRVQSVAKIMEAESNTNAGLSAETNKLNAVIEANNNSLVNNYNQERVARQMKKLELSSENIADASEKLGVQIKDSNSKKVDKMKFAIALANDTDGSAWRGMKNIASEYFNEEEILAYEQVAKARQARAKKDAEMLAGMNAYKAAAKTETTQLAKTETKPTEVKAEDKKPDAGKKETGKTAAKTSAPASTTPSKKAVPGTPAGTTVKSTAPAKKAVSSLVAKSLETDNYSNSFSPTKETARAAIKTPKQKVTEAAKKLVDPNISKKEKDYYTKVFNANYTQEHDVIKEVKEAFDKKFAKQPNVGGVSGFNFNRKPNTKKTK